jgi:polar amino acid transport system substrate-binding protein
MEFNSIIASVTTGKADIGVAGMTDTADRRENVDFSIPYWVAVQTIIVPETNTDITSAESLKGKKVGVVTGYTGDSALSDMGDINLMRFNKGIDAVMELTNGKLDAVVIDSPTANRFIEKFDGLKAVYDDTVFETEQYAIAVQKGNQELLDKINSTIERLIANKDIERFAEEIDARFQS